MVSSTLPEAKLIRWMEDRVTRVTEDCITRVEEQKTGIGQEEFLQVFLPHW